MELRQLGNTDLNVSPLGLGTVKFGRNQGVKYPSGFDIPEEGDLAALLSLAKDLGINLLDTAPAYGASEERLGRLLQGQRQDWVIVGKAGEEFTDGASSYNFTPAHFEISLTRTLQRLETDYLDVFLIHSDGNDLANLSDELINTMQSFKERGLVRSIGASIKTPEGGLKALETMDVVMATYTPLYLEEKPVLDYAASHNKGVLLKKVLSSGHEADIEAAFAHAFVHPGVSAAIIGTINPAHLRENVRALEKLKL
ncbi:MAG: aldo/keto reductase [Alphaproteobacteria bacterium]|nr:aldo/keto reductase [Alphaproteobacteria bacterium]